MPVHIWSTGPSAEELAGFVELGTELRAIGPAATLKRGYSILAQEDGSVIASVEDLTEGERIRATLADGESWLTPEKESRGGDGI